MATKKPALKTFKCSFTTFSGMEYVRYMEAENGSIALDDMLIKLELRTREIKKETVRCDEQAPALITADFLFGRG